MLPAILPPRRYPLIVYAIRYGSVNTARYLLTAQRLEPDQLREAVRIAIERDERSMLDAIRSAGWRADDHDYDYLLQAMDKPHSLAARGEIQTLWFIKRGVQINARNSDGETALHVAAKHGQREFVKMLLNQGADAKIEDCKGNSAPIALD